MLYFRPIWRRHKKYFYIEQLRSSQDRLPMIPIALDPAMLSIALVGRGNLAVRRFGSLHAGGARRLTVYSDAPRPLLVQAAGDLLVRRLPSPGDLAGTQLLWIADLPRSEAERLAAAARAGQVLVNVEADRPLCDSVGRPQD